MSTVAQQIFPARILDRVVHHKRAPYDTLVDRSTPWGNPFPLSDYPDRIACIEAYLVWLLARPGSPYDPQWLVGYDQKWVCDHVHQLQDDVLGCWCAPKLCHGHVLAAMSAADDPAEAVRWIWRKLQDLKE